MSGSKIHHGILQRQEQWQAWHHAHCPIALMCQEPYTTGRGLAKPGWKLLHHHREYFFFFPFLPCRHKFQKASIPHSHGVYSKKCSLPKDDFSNLSSPCCSLRHSWPMPVDCLTSRTTPSWPRKAASAAGTCNPGEQCNAGVKILREVGMSEPKQKEEDND